MLPLTIDGHRFTSRADITEAIDSLQSELDSADDISAHFANVLRDRLEALNYILATSP